MKTLIPSNIFAAIFAFLLSDDKKAGVTAKPSSLICTELEKGNADIAIIPSLDLMKHRNLFVSKSFAISFDGMLSNSYLYFKPNQNDFKSLYLRGDVSTNEVVLSKILFAEKYSSEIDIRLDTGKINTEENNYLICGDDNFGKSYLNNGISFSDDIADLINYPYTNYLLASRDESALHNFTEGLKGIDKLVEDKIGSFIEIMKINKEAEDLILENINSIYYELTENEIFGLNELLRLPYFHGIIEDVIEIKFI
jgi:predicted solute-binding protein